MHEVGSGHFAPGIERRLAKSPRGRGIPAEQSAAISHDQAGALLSLPQGLKAAKIIDDKCAHSCSNTPDEIKRMAKKQGVSYRTALRWFHGGTLPVKATQEE